MRIFFDIILLNIGKKKKERKYLALSKTVNVLCEIRQYVYL